MSFFNAYLDNALTDALGWTIIHSLWQGLCIGIIVLLILKIHTKSTSQFKYLIGVFALAAILTSSLITFIIEYQPDYLAGMHPPVSSLENSWQSHVSLPFGETGKEIWNPRMLAFQQTISTSFKWMTFFWMLGVLILSFRLTGGMILVNRLRTREVSPVPAQWEERLLALAGKAGIRRTLQFFQSTRVKVPTVIGILSPLVIIPAGIISLMPVDQLESILAHEIAHIRRYDFLINIFQSLVEALFFYHPVIWLISENLRQEREKCCDDFAVALCGDLSVYARALTGLSELQVRSALPSVALTGTRNRIISRVERLINTKKMKTNASEKIIAGLVILCSAIVVTLSTGAGVQSQSEIAAEPAMSIIPDTCSWHEHINMEVKDNVVIREFVTKDGEERSIKFVIRKGKVEELFVNGEEIPQTEFPEYEKEIERTMLDLDEMEQELREAKQELAEMDFEKIYREVEANIENFQQQYMLEIQEQMEQMQKEQVDIQLDRQKMQEEIKNALENIKIINEKELQELITEQMLALEEIDYDEIQEDMERAMKEIENINFTEIERNLQESLKHFEKERLNIDKEMENIDDLIDEIGKLELEEK